jgi:diguanylate cyclase (GGDEF)-like protein
MAGHPARWDDAAIARVESRCPVPVRCLLLLLLAWFGTVHAATPLVLDADAPDAIDLRPHLEMLHDPGAALDPRSLRSASFVALPPGSGLNFGYTRGAMWLRLALQSRASEAAEWRLELDYPSLDRAELFDAADSGKAPLQRSGDTLRFDQRSVPHRNPVFVIGLAPGERRELLLRVQSEGSLTVNPRLWRAEAFHEHSASAYAAQALYLGMLLALAAYNFLLWLALRDRAFLLYVVFVLGCGVGIASIYGFAGQFLWPDWIEWSNRALSTGIAIAGIVGPLFTRAFLDTRRRAPGWHRALGAVAWLHVAVLGLALFGPLRLGMQTMSATTMLGCAAMLGCGIACALRGDPGARLFVLAWAALLLGGVLMALRNFGLVPTNFLTLYAMQIGSALEMLLLSFALAARFNQLRREKEQAQAETLASQQRLVSTLQQQERVLEERVAERTEALAAANARLSELALRDPLTGLANRAALYARLEQALDGARMHGRAVALLMLDLDGFKAVNDRLGHEAGDRLLVAVAERLIRCARFNDLVARLGGDEFVLVVEDAASPAQAQALADALLAALAAPFALGPEQARIGASIGVALSDAHGSEADTLLRRADRAMYAAKAAGRGSIRWAEEEPGVAEAREPAPVPLERG